MSGKNERGKPLTHLLPNHLAQIHKTRRGKPGRFPKHDVEEQFCRRKAPPIPLVIEVAGKYDTIMRYLRSLPFALALGCGQAPPPPQAPEAAAIAPIPVAATERVAPATVATKPKVVAPTTDLGTEAVNRVLAPTLPPAPLPAMAQPRPRQSDIDHGEIPEKPATYLLPNSGMPQAKPVRISPPKEKAPSDLGSIPFTPPTKP
jgi:hypothetical protein